VRVRHEQEAIDQSGQKEKAQMVYEGLTIDCGAVERAGLRREASVIEDRHWYVLMLHDMAIIWRINQLVQEES